MIKERIIKKSYKKAIGVLESACGYFRDVSSKTNSISKEAINNSVESFRNSLFLHYDFLLILSILDVYKNSIQFNKSEGDKYLKDALLFIKTFSFYSNIDFEDWVCELNSEEFAIDDLLDLNYNQLSNFLDELYENWLNIDYDSLNQISIIVFLFFKPRNQPVKKEYNIFMDSTNEIFDYLDTARNATVRGLSRMCTSFYDFVSRVKENLKQQLK